MTGHGADACTQDQGRVRKAIRDKVRAAGLRLDFRFVGYKTPAGQRIACPGFFVAYGKQPMFPGVIPLKLGLPRASQWREEGEGTSCPGHPGLEPAQEPSEGVRLLASGTKPIGGLP
ncbi:hypothetical protein [Actinomadura sp. DC4]|uniref:hypothetical protein n=1 Tax=Actinomadura sp. DC4 TaxID=3055069 RepID=UPI0025B0A6F9|nr:hypothetical protein [Actinomadura sp. DC4]MDN3359007.1 hypothetical protein [Actinomadura sp. DC4]